MKQVKEKIIRILWFLSSYIPLWVILGICNFESDEQGNITGLGLMTYMFFGTALATGLFLWFYIRKIRKQENKEVIQVTSISAVTNLTEQYIVEYLLSLVTFGTLEDKEHIAFWVLTAFFGFFFVRYKEFIYNPMIDLFGYRVYNVDWVYPNNPNNNENKSNILVAKAKKDFLLENPIHVTSVSNGVCFAIDDEKTKRLE